MRNAFAKYPGFEAVEITDIVTEDFGQIMKGKSHHTRSSVELKANVIGMDAVILCAAPMISGKADPETALKVVEAFSIVYTSNHQLIGRHRRIVECLAAS